MVIVKTILALLLASSSIESARVRAHKRVPSSSLMESNEETSSTEEALEQSKVPKDDAVAGWGQNTIEFGKGSKASDMPEVDPNAELDVFYAEVPLLGSDVMAGMHQYHSGLTFKYKGTDGKKTWTVELYAKDGMSAALCPKIDEDGLPTWSDAVVVGFREDETLNSTPDMHLKETYLGSIRGSVFNNNYRKFVASYLEKHGTYQIFDVISFDKQPDQKSAPDSTRPMKSATCDSFSEASMKFLGGVRGLGSSSIHDSQEVPEIRRNYAFILSASNDELVEVNRSDAALAKFYETYAAICEKKAETIITGAVWTMIGETAFVQLSGKYYKVQLGKGMFAAKYALMETVW